MDIEAAEIELYLRKYLWAVKDFMHETEDGFPLLRNLSVRWVQQFLIYVQQFSASEQVVLARALVKSANLSAVKLLKEDYTDEEEVMVKTYRAEVRNIVPPAIPNPAIPNSVLTKTFAVKRADVAKTVLPVLSNAFDKKPQKFASLHWFYILPAGDWQFHIELDFSGTWGTEIRCWHRLVRSDGRSWGLLFMPLQSAEGLVRVSQAFSLLSLYGISPTTYYISSMADVNSATDSILAAHYRLSQAVPNWVDQLTIN
jgi:hypothetical protein